MSWILVHTEAGTPRLINLNHVREITRNELGGMHLWWDDGAAVRVQESFDELVKDLADD